MGIKQSEVYRNWLTVIATSKYAHVIMLHELYVYSKLFRGREVQSSKCHVVPEKGGVKYIVYSIIISVMLWCKPWPLNRACSRSTLHTCAVLKEINCILSTCTQTHYCTLLLYCQPFDPGLQQTCLLYIVGGEELHKCFGINYSSMI